MDNPTQDSPLPDTLPALAEAAKAHRLSPAEEEKATALLCEQLKGGRAGITAVIEPLLSFPWIVSVNAIAAVWNDLSLPMQRHLVSGLAKVETEQARRLRLSVARAVFKLDAAAGARLAIAVAADLKNPETGTLSTRNRQLFFHVFVGKGRPWLCLLPLEGAKGADALVQAAIETLPLCPPLSQLSIMRWIYTGGRFKRLTAEHLALVAKSAARWNYRLQQALKAEIPDLPEVIASVLKPERPEPKPEEQKAAEPVPARGTAVSKESKEAELDAASEGAEESEEAKASERTEGAAEAEGQDDAAGEPRAASEEARGEKEDGAASQTREERQAARRRERDAYREEQREQREQRRRERGDRGEQRSERGERSERAERSDRAERPERGERTDRGERAERAERSEREPEKAGAEGERRRKAFDPKTFDLRDSLRGVESYVASLRQELEQTKALLRRKDDESISSRRARRNREEPASPSVDAEELTRHNARLESTIIDLRQQLEDLASHHEAVAESRLLHGDEPLEEGSADQLRTLFNIKLHEAYETFLVMKQDPLDRVFRLDYRDLLGSVFEVLQQEGITLKKP